VDEVLGFAFAIGGAFYIASCAPASARGVFI